MHICHVALQGCLRPSPVEYGVCADTGGHIRYLLDLVAALEQHPAVTRQTIVTRGFVAPALGDAYSRPLERLSERTTLVRIFGRIPGYLGKEELFRDMPSLTAAFLRMLAGQPRLPDLVHAHYADAGTLAAAAKARLGIPYLFSAHSLGAMKRLAMGVAAEGSDGLAMREAIEDRAIAAADLVVASSRDEAEGQLPAYPSARPDRIAINAPGCDLAAFARPVPAATAAAVAARIDAELDRPGLPPILSLARPVRRKNLAALVAAYAADPALRERANLVVVAGSSHDGAMLSAENRAVLAALAGLVRSCGLAGSVSLPAHHGPDEVPAIYAYAATRGGVFVNPALHEPFGLTLIEAAAAGLPVVATDRGGPRDIVADLCHGVVVDPTDPSAIAGALTRILSDKGAYAGYVAAGRENVGRYTWDRHAKLYARVARRLTRAAPPAVDRRGFGALLLCDLDGTLTGCSDGTARLAAWRRRHPGVLFGVATGRSLHDAIAVIGREGIAPPGVLATSLGSEIYFVTDPDFGVVADEAWAEQLAADWDADAVVRCLSSDPHLEPQPAMEQRRFKRSWFASLSPRQVAAVGQRLAKAGLAANVAYSHGRFLDVLPRAASKGAALAYLRHRFGIPRAMTAAAGDSGTDLSLLREAGRGVVVANHGGGLAGLRGRPNVVFSRDAHAGGIVAGLEGWPAPALPRPSPASHAESHADVA